MSSPTLDEAEIYLEGSGLLSANVADLVIELRGDFRKLARNGYG
jgi:hypothetical protein